MPAQTSAPLAAQIYPDDRRRASRRPHVAEAWIASPTALEERIEVQTVNLSRHGVKFALPKPVAPGTFYVMNVNMGPQSIRSEVRIISCRREGELYEIGAEFC